MLSPPHLWADPGVVRDGCWRSVEHPRVPAINRGMEILFTASSLLCTALENNFVLDVQEESRCTMMSCQFVDACDGYRRGGSLGPSRICFLIALLINLLLEEVS